MEKKDFVIFNRNGKRMPATLRVPHTPVKGSALFLHGLGGFRSQKIIAVAADALCRAGYQTLVFDASDGAHAPDADFFHATTSGYVCDVEDAIAWMKTESWYEHLSVFGGHSQGGLAALAYLERHPTELPEKLLLLAPLVSWNANTLSTKLLGLLGIFFGKFKVWGPDKKKLWLSKNWIIDFFSFDAVRAMRDIPIPTLLFSAQKDDTVGRKKVHTLVQKTNTHCTLCLIVGAPHTFSGHEKEVADRITTWLTQS